MLLKKSLIFKPDLYISHGSMYASQIAFLLNKPHISFEDTFNFEQINLYKPFTSVILTSSYDHPYIGRKNIKYNGYHELAYLHPNRFIPDLSIKNELGLLKNEKYCLLRFVSWDASHDLNHSGMSLKNKRKLVKKLSKYCKVIISSEKKLPLDLEKFKYNLCPSKMHDLIAGASLIFGESATMITEGAILGVPGIYLDNNGRLYTKEIEEKYELIKNFGESEEDQILAIDFALNLIKNNHKDFSKKAKKLINDKIDVTDFLVDFVNNFMNKNIT